MAFTLGSSSFGQEVVPDKLTPQAVRDIIGAMFTGSASQGISPAYDADSGKINLDVLATVSPTPINFDDINAAITRHLQGRDSGEYWPIINKD